MRSHRTGERALSASGVTVRCKIISNHNLSVLLEKPPAPNVLSASRTFSRVRRIWLTEFQQSGLSVFCIMQVNVAVYGYLVC